MGKHGKSESSTTGGVLGIVGSAPVTEQVRADAILVDAAYEKAAQEPRPFIGGHDGRKEG